MVDCRLRCYGGTLLLDVDIPSFSDSRQYFARGRRKGEAHLVPFSAHMLVESDAIPKVP